MPEDFEGSFMMVHSSEDVKQLDGFYVGNLITDDPLIKGKPYMVENRKTNEGLPNTVRSDTRAGNYRAFKKLRKHYDTKVAGRRVWFEQFKLDKIKQNVIKTWDSETIMYLRSTYDEWTKFQELNPVLLQNYFLPEELYNLKRWRSEKWDLQLGLINDCCQVLRIYDPNMYTFLSGLCREYNITTKSYVDIMKVYSNMVKAFNNDWREDWKRLIDLGRLTTFSKHIDPLEYVDDVRSWLQDTTKSRHYINKSEEQFIAEFKISVGELLSNNVPKRKHTLDEFLSMPHLWAVTGSAKTGLVADTIMINGEPTPLNKSKRSIAYTNTTADLKREMFYSESVNSVFDKSEVNRNRPVVNSDFGMFLAMSALDDQVYDMINEGMNQWSPIFKKYNFIKDRNYQIRKIGKWVCVPLDQKGFERQTSFQMLECILEVIRSRMDADDHESQQVLDVIQKKMFNAKLYFSHEGTKYINMEDITNGLSSGWKWTALFNTIINLSEFLTCARQLGWVRGLDYTNICALGDDTRIWVKSFAHAEALLNWYENAHIEVNRKLAIVSRTCDEFLRKVTERVGNLATFRGYANRMCAPIVYRNPKSREPNSLHDALTTTAQNWLDLASRCSEPNAKDNICQVAMCNDLRKVCLAYGLNMPNDDFIFTSVAEGGMGVTPLRKGSVVPVQNHLITQPSVRYSRRMTEILNATINRYGLQQMYHDVDRDFQDTFLSESASRKIHSYAVEPVQKMYLGKITAHAERKIAEFTATLLDSFKDSGPSEFDLPYKKGDFVPKSEIIGSGFFRSIYESTPRDERKYLFTVPAVYDRLLHRLGPKLCDEIVIKGLQWVSFRTWKYSVDFYNTLASQYFMYWIDNRLTAEISVDALQILTNKYLDEALSEQKWFISN
jgi:hypothetical protein